MLYKVLEHNHLALGQVPRPPPRKVLFRKPREVHPVELDHAVAQRFKHAPNDAVAARMDLYADLVEPRALDAVDLVGHDRSVLEDEAFFEFFEVLVGDLFI